MEKILPAMSASGKFRAIATGLKFYPRIRYLKYYRRILENTGKPPPAERSKAEARKLRDLLIKSGPLFIKLGQMLSSRRDIVPEEYLDILSELQDDVPMPEFSEVKKELEDEIGRIEEVFDEFDVKGISGASLGLVYRAKYKGNWVAVKINRPNIREIIRRDRPKILEFINLLSSNTGRSFALGPFFEEFLASIDLELDYKREAESIEIIKDKISDLELEIPVKVPKVYKEISTKRVLVMEFLEFIKITDLEELKKNRVNLRRLAVTVDKLFLSLALREGRFHADPHPGNLGWTKDGKIALMDYGMTSELSDEVRTKLIMAYYYLAKLDARNLLRVLVDMGIVDPLADRTVMEAGIQMVLKDFQGKELDQMEFHELMSRADALLIRFPFRLPNNLAMFARMSVILEGVCKTLDEKFNFVSVVMEIMEEERSSWQVLKNRILGMPEAIEKVFRDFLDIPELLRSINRRENKEKKGNITSPIIASGFLISGSILLQRPEYSAIMFAGALIFIVISFRRY